MVQVSYCIPFLKLVGDPAPCWHGGQFDATRSDCQAEHLLVWSAVMGVSAINGSSLEGFLRSAQGAMFPEVYQGFLRLECQRSGGVCEAVIKELGESFPRTVALRSEAMGTASRSEWLADQQRELWEHLEAEQYQQRAEDYFRSVCEPLGIEPVRYGR